MSSSSEDDVPLAARAAQAQAAVAAAVVAAPPVANGATAPGARGTGAASGSGVRKRPPPARRDDSSDDDDDESDASSSSGSGSADESDSDSEEDRPLSQRRTPSANKKPAPAAKKQPSRRASAPAAKRQKSGRSGGSAGGGKKAKGEQKWQTLEHNGVLFPPEYEPHGVKMLYEGKPVDLTPEQEEVASMFAVMRETEYMQKDRFLTNFWDGFKDVLGRGHVIKSLAKCDFTPIYDHLMAERERKKALSKEEKAAAKAAKDAAEAKYKTAYVDGRAEQVGNFRVEPPSLFRGRGEHPKMGKIKGRVYPRDITINIGQGAPVPQHPYPGQTWKEIRHDKTVTWLAFWKDTVNPKDFKYVWLGANSAFKSESDLLKYEKARKLKGFIDQIRRNYTRDWDSPDLRRKQMAVAVYFLDKLALRAGHEKDEDEADTVGCCTLKVENVECVAPDHIKFDFLGKDSIKYENTVKVDVKVYKAVEQFTRTNAQGKRKGPRDMLFDTFAAQDLNQELKGLMDGLSVKVFRTYNASIVLDQLLTEMEQEAEAKGEVYAERGLTEKKADYDRANKEVAILCNHQRSVPKTHEASMAKVTEKLNTLREEIQELEAEHKAAIKGKGKGDADKLKARIDKKLAALANAEIQARSKDENKTVALGTSKINYMDPRITIAWCKRAEVPIEKVFPKTLLNKFHWCMDVTSGFRF